MDARRAPAAPARRPPSRQHALRRQGGAAAATPTAANAAAPAQRRSQGRPHLPRPRPGPRRSHARHRQGPRSRSRASSASHLAASASTERPHRRAGARHEHHCDAPRRTATRTQTKTGTTTATAHARPRLSTNSVTQHAVERRSQERQRVRHASLSGQHAVEAELAQGKVVVLLFWNPSGADDECRAPQVQSQAVTAAAATSPSSEAARQPGRLLRLDHQRRAGRTRRRRLLVNKQRADDRAHRPAGHLLDRTGDRRSPQQP